MASIGNIASTADFDSRADKLSRIKAIVAASSGNLVEWYDFYAYAYAYAFTSIYFAAAFLATLRR